MTAANPTAFQQYNWDQSQFAPTRLQQQLDHYAANWSPINNAPFAYTPIATKHWASGSPTAPPSLQGRSFLPPISPPVNNPFLPLAQNPALFAPPQMPTLGGAPSQPQPFMGFGSQFTQGMV